MKKKIIIIIFFILVVLTHITLYSASLSLKKLYYKQKHNIIISIKNKKYSHFYHNQYIDKLWGGMFDIMYSKNKKIIITNIEEKYLKIRIHNLNQKSKMKIFKYNTMVHASIESYLRMSKYIGKMIYLSNVYFPMIDKKLKNYHLPKELKYLAIIESSLNPYATSIMGAKGLWQFMYDTGKIYGLKINYIHDDRIDPFKSTEAACRYFRYLYEHIKNWELVLYAYNLGPKKINKILVGISHYKKNNYKMLDFLPKETKNYITRFIAMNYVMNYYKEHHIPYE
ncbi:lytic transglycosylase domain-containing protein [Blattabacterium cuenoti]|uniref:lytic transglycosylase domain-containing protein n=1 Tax=Blattabacterium cuenoti TaxID=1653831 RepID=UPI00163C93E4|nr:lytic transglycosylase domain-containing protein [Blattabacterium cuenoti]